MKGWRVLWRSRSGITLVSLIITVTVMAILASSIVIVSLNSIDYTGENKFIAEIKIIKERVNIVNKETAIGSIAYSDVGRKISDLTETEKEKAQVAFSAEGVSSEEQANYRYFNMADLKKLGIYDIELSVLINFENLKIISVDGISINDKTYYTVESLEKIM